MAFNRNFGGNFRTMGQTGSRAPMQNVQLPTNKSAYRTPTGSTSVTQNPNNTQFNGQQAIQMAGMLGKMAKSYAVDKAAGPAEGAVKHATVSAQQAPQASLNGVTPPGTSPDSVADINGFHNTSGNYMMEAGKFSGPEGTNMPWSFDRSGIHQLGSETGNFQDPKSAYDAMLGKFQAGEAAAPGQAASVAGGATDMAAGAADAVDATAQAGQTGAEIADAASQAAELGTDAASGAASATPYGSILGMGTSLANGDAGQAAVHAAAASMNAIPVYGQAASAATEGVNALGRGFGWW